MNSLRRLLALVVLVAGTATALPALAEDPPAAADQAAVQQVIAGQIQAFLREDGEAAYSYAAPHIKQKFGSPSVFMKMVREAYSPVYSPAAYDFGPAAQRDNQIVQEVFLTAPDGSQVLALYRLERMEDGSWKIGAVFLREMPDQMT